MMRKPPSCCCFHYSLQQPLALPRKKGRISIALSHFFPSSLANICDCRDLDLPGAHELIMNALVTERHAAFSFPSELEWWSLSPTLKPTVHELMPGYHVFFKQQASQQQAMHMPQWFSSGKVKILEEYHFKRQTLDSSQRFPSPVWLHTPTSHLALRYLLDSQWTGTAHCLTENWSMTKCINFLQGQWGELAHRGPLSAEADTDVEHFGSERGKKKKTASQMLKPLTKIYRETAHKPHTHFDCNLTSSSKLHFCGNHDP